MSRLAVFLCALVACSLVLSVAGGPLPASERQAMRRAVQESREYFERMIQQNEAAAEEQINIREAIKGLQTKINANKEAYIPKPINPEVKIYLRDGDKTQVHGGSIAQTSEEELAELEQNLPAEPIEESEAKSEAPSTQDKSHLKI